MKVPLKFQLASFLVSPAITSSFSFVTLTINTCTAGRSVSLPCSQQHRTRTHTNRRAVRLYAAEPEVSTEETTTTTTQKNMKAIESDTDDLDENLDALTTLAGNIVQCLVKSDLKRKGGGDGGGSTGWTSWVDDKSAFSLQCCIDALALSKPINPSEISGLKQLQQDQQETLMNRDEAIAWLKWMKATPSPIMVDLSHELRDVADSLIYDKDLELIDSTREEFLER